MRSSSSDVADTGASYSLVFLNRFSVRYPRGLVASGGTLEGTLRLVGPGGGGRAPAPRASSSTRRRLRAGGKGALPTPTGLSFPVEAGRSYLATSVLQRPLVRKIQGSALKKTENQADYLLLAPRAFLDAAQPLLALRAERGTLDDGGFPRGRLRAVRARGGFAGGDQGLPGVRVPVLGLAVSPLRAPPGGRELRPQGLPADGGEGLAAGIPGEDELPLDGVGPDVRERERRGPSSRTWQSGDCRREAWTRLRNWSRNY